MKILVLSLLCLIHHSRSHSWIACSDYTEKNGADWDPDKCRGFPRDGHRYTQKKSFGQDTGFDYKPSGASNGCKTKYSESSYNDDYPKAVYYPGQQVILTHPMKNHGADVCTNQYIPDFGNKIYRGKKNQDRDRSFSYYRSITVADLGTSPTGYAASSVYTKYPKPGYQNAPNFCKNTDKSMGTYAFNVPEDLDAGEYTFLWRWSFNGAQDIYTTCFDVIVTEDKQKRDLILSDRGFITSVACGGVTSDGSTPGSILGCDDVVLPPSPPTTTTTTTARPQTTTTSTLSPSGQTTKSTTTTVPPPQVIEGDIMVKQVAGDIELTPAGSDVDVRYVSVQFSCAVDAHFWKARTLGSRESRIFDLVQEQTGDIASNKVSFTATFKQPCNLETHPIYASILVE